MGMMHVLDVANFFLSKGVPNTQQAITHLKLQKLVYYAQAFYLAFGCDEKPSYQQKLFDDPLQAWTHGPVSPKVYAKYQGNKNRFEELPRFEGVIPIPDEYIGAILDAVWKTYGNYSGSQLEYFTHREDPWVNARKRANVKDWEPSTELICLEDMKAYYKGLLQ